MCITTSRSLQKPRAAMKFRGSLNLSCAITVNSFYLFGIPVGGIFTAVAAWEQKVRWCFYFGHVVEENLEDTWRFIRAQKSVPRTCHHPLPAEFEVRLRDVVSALQNAGQRAWNTRWRLSRPLSPLYKVAWSRLRFSRWCALPTDKGGGFCLMLKSQLQQMKKNILADKRHYFSEAYFEEKASEIFEMYTYAVKKISDHERALGAFCSAAHNHGIKGILSRLQCTIKTHKDPGEVKPRPIHAAVSSPLKPGMKWISHILRQELDKYPHLVKDTPALLDLVRRTPVPENAVLIKVDIKDFLCLVSAMS